MGFAWHPALLMFHIAGHAESDGHSGDDMADRTLAGYVMSGLGLVLVGHGDRALGWIDGMAIGTLAGDVIGSI